MICADKKELELKLPTPFNNAKKSTHKIILTTSYNPVFAGEVPSSYCSSSPFCDWNPQFKSEVADIPNFIWSNLQSFLYEIYWHLLFGWWKNLQNSSDWSVFPGEFPPLLWLEFVAATNSLSFPNANPRGFAELNIVKLYVLSFASSCCQNLFLMSYCGWLRHPAWSLLET